MVRRDEDHSRRHDRDRAFRTRSRSRSPYRSPRHTSDVGRRRHERTRSRSPSRKDEHERHHSHKRRRTDQAVAVQLPFNARQISKHDFDEYKPTFALYLDIQKQLILEELDEREAKGRWKSFMGRWNRGELAEGWYDSATKRRADESASNSAGQMQDTRHKRASPEYGGRSHTAGDQPAGPQDEDDSEDEFGPAVPPPMKRDVQARAAGPAIPNLEDLELKREQDLEDRELAYADLKHHRKLDRRDQREKLDELVPRPDPGSRDRLLEKRAATSSLHRGFADARTAGVADVPDADLMGEDGLDAYKARKRADERAKTDREIRREEEWRARQEAREERLREHREKEERVLDMFRGLVKERFGGGGGGAAGGGSGSSGARW